MRQGRIAERQLNIREFIEKIEHIEREGLPVWLRFRAVPDDWAMYDPRAANQALLMIYTDPLEGFEELIREGVVLQDPNPYHISLCFAPELRRFNLYDPNVGIERGLEAYNRLRMVYDGRRARLIVRISNTAANIRSVEVDQAPDLMTDADFNALREAGTYYDRRIHISM